MINFLINSRSFDVQATGRIPESMFVQLMKTKQVPEEDVQEMLQGDKKATECVRD